MNFSKRELVTLVKVLAVHQNNYLAAGTSDLQRDVDAMLRKVEAYLGDEMEKTPLAPDSNNPYDYYEGEDEEFFDEEEQEDEEEIKAASSEEDEEDDEKPRKDKESSSVPGDGEALDAEYEISVLGLLELPKLTTNLGKLKFTMDGSQLNLLVLEAGVKSDDSFEIYDVTYLRRFGKELHVAEYHIHGDKWTKFEVKKYPRGWTEALPLGELVEVNR